MAKARDYVDQCKNTVESAVNSLQQAIGSAEKPDNRTKIQNAINSLNAAKEQLNNYQD